MTTEVLAAVRRYGRVASVYQTLTPRFSHWVDPTTGCIVASVKVRASPAGPPVWVAAGEPIGPVEAVAAAAESFERSAAATGAEALWFGVESLERLGTRGTALVVGAQPLWLAGGWDGRLARKASLRAQVNRARNKGIAVDEVAPGWSPALRPILEAWIARRGMPALSFLADPNILDHLIDRRLFVARRGDDTVAYLVLAPIPARGGWHVEWIIQAPSAPNGTASLLVDAVCHALPADAPLTLGLVPLSTKAPLSANAPPHTVRALLAWTRAHARRFYNFEGLERFKAKFLPDAWEPVYLVTPHPRVSLSTFYAVADAFAGERSPFQLIGRALADAVASEARMALRGLSSRGS